MCDCSMSALPGWFRHWCDWSFHRPLGHHVWVRLPSPPCPNTDRIGAAWSPLIQIPEELLAHPSLSHICDEKSQLGRTCGLIFHSFWRDFVLFKWHCVISEDYQHLCGLSVLIHVLRTLHIQYNLCTLAKTESKNRLKTVLQSFAVCTYI